LITTLVPAFSTPVYFFVRNYFETIGDLFWRNLAIVAFQFKDHLHVRFCDAKSHSCPWNGAGLLNKSVIVALRVLVALCKNVQVRLECSTNRPLKFETGTKMRLYRPGQVRMRKRTSKSDV